MKALTVSKPAWAIASFFLVVAFAQEGESTSAEKSSDDAESQTEFAFNIFSDIAPILALFGEQFATQYLSQSFTWLDHVIFACVPLGIVTALSAAIRVQGAPWMRSFIGRARENRATAEIELMSSTSNEVCEVFNGKAIVRIMGRPQIAQIVFFPDLYGKDSNGTSSGLFNLQAALEKPNAKMTCEDSSGKSQDGSCSMHQNPADCLGPPNIQVNIAPDHYSHESSKRELLIAMVIAVMLQVGVITIAVVTVVHEPTRNAIGLRPDNYSLPAYVTGTAAIFLSMLICSHAIESSTIERKWRRSTSSSQDPGPSSDGSSGQQPSKGPSRESTKPSDKDSKTVSVQRKNPTDMKLFWIQRAQTVSDQSFGSYVILGGEKQHILTSSRKEAFQNKDGTKSTIQQVLTGLVNVIYAKRPAHDDTKEDGRSPEWEALSLLGVSLGAVGFVVQFIGLRGLAYPVSISHLAAIVVMALVRALIRRRLSRAPTCFPVMEGRELDCLAYQLTVNDDLRNFSDGSKSPFEKMSVTAISHWTVQTPLPNAPDPMATDQTDDSEPSQVKSCHTHELCLAPILQVGDPHSSPVDEDPSLLTQQLARTRRRLGDLCRWGSSEARTALAVTQGIESFLNIFVPFGTSSAAPGSTPGNRIEWQIRCCWPTVSTSGCQAKQFISVNINFKNGKWEVEIGELEAVLSLWVASFEANKLLRENNLKARQKRANSEWRRGTSIKIQFLRVLGIDLKDGALKRDISWWVGQDVARRSESSRWNVSTGVSGQESDIVIGFHGPDNEEYAKHQARFASDPESARILAVSSSDQLLNVFAQHLLTSFMWAIAPILPNDVFRQKTAAGDDDVELTHPYQLTDQTASGNQAWYPCSLRSSKLSRVVASMESAGLGTANDILLCMIPALSWRDVLPNERVLDLIPSPQTTTEWCRVAGCYAKILRTSLEDETLRQQCFAYAVVVKTMRFLLVTCTKANDNERFRQELYLPLKALMEIVSNDGKEVIRALSPIYAKQRQLKTFVGYFAEYATGQNLDIFAEIEEVKLEDRIKHVLRFLLDHTSLGLKALPTMEPRLQAERLSQHWQTADLFGWTPIHYLIVQCSMEEHRKEVRSGALDRLKSALGDIGGDWNHLSSNGHCTGPGLLHLATSLELKEVVQLLLNARVKPDSLDPLGYFPLAYVSMDGWSNGIASSLLHHWDNVELQDEKGETCLHWTVRCAEENILKTFLKEKNAFPILNTADNTGRTPLHVASQEGKHDNARALILNNARLGVTDHSGKTAFHYAVCTESESTFQIVQALHERRLDIEAQDVDGCTPLHVAILQKNLGMAQKLILQYKSNARARENDGATPLMLACKVGFQGFVDWISDPGSTPEHTSENFELQSMIKDMDKNGRNCVHYASTSDEKISEVLPILISKGVDINLTDAGGATPLLYAIKNKNQRNALDLIRRPEIDFAVDKEYIRSLLISAIQARCLRVVAHLFRKSIFRDGCVHLLQETTESLPEDQDIDLKELIEAAAVSLPLNYVAEALTRGKQLLSRDSISDILQIICFRAELEDEPIENLQPFFLLSVQFGNINLLRILIDKKVNPFHLDEDKWSCLDLAETYGQVEMTLLLEKYIETLTPPKSFKYTTTLSPTRMQSPAKFDQPWLSVQSVDKDHKLEPQEGHDQKCIFDIRVSAIRQEDRNNAEVGRHRTRRNNRTIRSDYCIPPGMDNYYFEVEILSGCSNISVGFCHDAHLGDLNAKLGSEAGSISMIKIGWIRMFEGGEKYRATSEPIFFEDCNNSFADGHTVGAGINITTGDVYWTRNGKRLDTEITGEVSIEKLFGSVFDLDHRGPGTDVQRSAWARPPEKLAIRLGLKHGKLYPAIGITGLHAHAKVKLQATPEDPFKFPGPYKFSYEDRTQSSE